MVEKGDGEESQHLVGEGADFERQRLGRVGIENKIIYSRIGLYWWVWASRDLALLGRMSVS